MLAPLCYLTLLLTWNSSYLKLPLTWNSIECVLVEDGGGGRRRSLGVRMGTRISSPPHKGRLTTTRVADPKPVLKMSFDPDPLFKFEVESGFKNLAGSGLNIKV